MTASSVGEGEKLRVPHNNSIPLARVNLCRGHITGGEEATTTGVTAALSGRVVWTGGKLDYITREGLVISRATLNGNSSSAKTKTSED